MCICHTEHVWAETGQPVLAAIWHSLKAPWGSQSYCLSLCAASQVVGLLEPRCDKFDTQTMYFVYTEFSVFEAVLAAAVLS